MLKLCGCGVGGRAAQAPGSFVSRASGESQDDLIDAYRNKTNCAGGQFF